MGMSIENYLKTSYLMLILWRSFSCDNRLSLQIIILSEGEPETLINVAGTKLKRI